MLPKLRYPASASPTACFVFVLILRSILLADPAASTPPPCLSEDLEKAKAALKEAKEKSAEIVQKLPAGKFTKDFENDKQAADLEVKIKTTSLETSKKRLEEVKKQLADVEKEKGVQHAGQTSAQVGQTTDETLTKFKANIEALAKARKAQAAFQQDAKFAEHAKQFEVEKADLKKQMSQYMDSEKADPIFEKLTDAAARLEAQRLMEDKSYQSIEFTEFTPDGDLRANGDRLAIQYAAFGDRKAAELRKQLLEALKNALQGQAGAHDKIRQLGPDLIKEIDRCREPVQKSFAKVSNRQDAIEKRMREIDADGADLAKDIPSLEAEEKKLTAQLAALDVQRELATRFGEVSFAKAEVEGAMQSLEEARKTAKAADQALTDFQAAHKSMEPWIQKEKAAETDIDRLNKLIEAEVKAKDAAKAKAEADYTANETTLSALKAKVKSERAAIDKLKTTDAKAANERIKTLREEVKTAKETALKTVEAIKTALDPYRKCFKDVDEYVEKTIKPKIVALGGRAEAGMGVSDFEDPLNAVLDVPVDKNTPEPLQSTVEQTGTGDEWVRLPPVISSNNVEGRLPKRLQSPGTTSFSYTIEQEGKTWTNTLRWSEPPASLKKGDKVTLKISSTSQEGWAYIGGWWNIRCTTRESLKGDTSAGSGKNFRLTGSPDPHNAICTFEFDPGSNPHIQFSGGREPSGDLWYLVTWKYERKKP